MPCTMICFTGLHTWAHCELSCGTHSLFFSLFNSLLGWLIGSTITLHLSPYLWAPQRPASWPLWPVLCFVFGSCAYQLIHHIPFAYSFYLCSFLSLVLICSLNCLWFQLWSLFDSLFELEISLWAQMHNC